MKNPLLVLCMVAMLAVIPEILSAQRQTNTAELERLSNSQEQMWKQAAKRAADWAKVNGIPVVQQLEDGTIIQLVDVENGLPVFLATENYGAAITTRAVELWEGGSLGLNLSGEGYDRIGEWDGGAVRLTHQEFNNTGVTRVIQVDGATSLSDHATHVAGTLVGGGVNINARGMNYNGILQAHDWNNAESEMATAGAAGLEISNHSYGTITGWRSNNGTWEWYGDPDISPVEDFRFGYYGSSARNWDVIANNAPYYLITKSAGNDRGDGPSNAGTGDVPELDGGEDGFDCIGSYGNAKNIMTVGAVQEVLNYNGPASVVMSSFSSWGPVDDGRIKPEVVAKGVGTYSAGSNSNTHYSTKNGTSMASPNAAGTMALLQQHYQNTHAGQPMLSSTLRALVIHTTDEAGPHEGPDYMFGWGLINAERAASIISEDDVLQNVIDEIDLAEGSLFSREMNVPGNSPLRITIAWNDPAGQVLPAALNDRTAVLVNDLDLRILGPDGSLYYPYRLDPDNPAEAPLTDGKNYVDNVEQVYIANPVEGNYSIIVDHDGALANGMQTFSLIVSGINEYQGLPFCSSGLISPLQGSEENILDLTIQWQQAAFALEYLVYFGTDGEGLETPTNVHNGLLSESNSIDVSLLPNSTYYLKVLPINDFGTNEDCAEIWTFSTLTAIESYPYIIDVEDITTPDLPASWQQIQNSDAKWVSTNLISHEGNKALGCFNPSGMILTDYDNWLFAPPLVVENGKEYMIRFYYRAFLPGTQEQLAVYWGSAATAEAMTEQLAVFTGFDGADGWMMAEVLLIPEEDSFGFLAIRAESTAGFGVFLDDFIIEDWGAVGVGEQNANNMQVFYQQGLLEVNLNESVSNGKLSILSADGRVLNQSLMNGSGFKSKGLNLRPGLYFLVIEAEGKLVKKRFLVNH